MAGNFLLKYCNKFLFLAYNYKNNYMKTLTKKHAIELSVMKWEYIVKHDGNSYEFLDELPELRTLVANCGLCEKYSDRLGGKFNCCYGCPLVIMTDNYDYNSDGCLQKDHPFHNWGKNNTKKNALKLLNVLKIILIKDENKRKRLSKKEIGERWKKSGLLNNPDKNEKYFLFRK